MSDENIPRIAGAGKGGGGAPARAPVEDPDSLQSRAMARVLDLIGEGEIEGLVDGLKSVYLDETPIQGADGALNFSGVTLQTRTGTQAQTYIPGFEAQEQEVSVGVEVTHATPVTRQITDPDVNAVRVTLGVPGLFSQNRTNGDVTGLNLDVSVYLQANGGSFVLQDLQGAGVIAGKTRSRYQRSYRIPLVGSSPWNIRVVRNTADHTDSSIQDKTWWDSYTEIVEAKFTYPNSALVGLTLDSTQMNHVPTRAYDVKLMRCKVPSNYNPLTRVYTGIWDGTFTVAWTDSPAWCFYDMVTNTRYGLGEHVPATLLDKWFLYTIAQYCDQLVSDGFGGMEPRFTMNVYLQTSAEAFRVVSDLASVFRGMLYWSTGGIFAVQDSPSDPVQLFTGANVIDGIFHRESSARKARHTVAVVQWNDPKDFYRLKPEYVEDAESILRYGIRPTAIVGFGCASQGQAHRVGKWLLFTEKYESEVISWGVGLDGTYVRPGQVVKVIDPALSSARWAGRVKAATSYSVTVDAAVLLSAGVTYTLTVMIPDGTMEDRVLTNAAGSATVLTFAAALPSTDLVEAIWGLGEPNLTPELVRVLAVTEESPTTYRITGLEHYAAKYAAVEQNLQLQRPAVSDLKAMPQPVKNLVGSESLYKQGGAVHVRFAISFTPSGYAFRYTVSYRHAEGNWVVFPADLSTHYEVDDASPGDYEIRVVAHSALGRSSQSAVASYTVLGKVAPPSDVPWFFISGKVLSWGTVPDLDLDGYQIRFNYGNNLDWGVATPMHLGLLTETPYEPPILPTGTITLLIKAIDTSQVESKNAAFIVADLGDPVTDNIIYHVDFDALGYPGTKTQCTVSGGNLVADVAGGSFYNEQDTASKYGLDSSAFYLQDTYRAMTYITPEVSVYSTLRNSTVTLDINTAGSGLRIEYRNAGPNPMYGVVDSDSFYGPDAEPCYEEPGEFSGWPGLISAGNAAYEFRVSLGEGPTQGAINTFTVNIDVPDQTEKLNDVVISGLGTRLPILKKYLSITSVQLTVQSNGGTAISARIVDKDATLGPLVQGLDAAGAVTACLLDATIIGLPALTA